MELLFKIIIWGFIIGVIHFIVLGVLYTNPFVAKIYNDSIDSPALRKWGSQKEYLIKMFLGTQIEIYILTAGYLYLRKLFSSSILDAVIIAVLFSCIRVYPRFWNMWIQTTYPGKLLAVEFVNGTAGTFLVVLGLYFLPTG